MTHLLDESTELFLDRSPHRTRRERYDLPAFGRLALLRVGNDRFQIVVESLSERVAPRRISAMIASGTIL